MPRQGLNKEKVVEAAIHFIETKGYHAFSMNELANDLGIKPASLYNHIESMDVLITEVGLQAVTQMVEYECESIEGKSKDNAIFALADAYRSFAREHAELYRIIMSLHKSKNEVMERAAGQVIEPYLKALSDYELSDDEQMLWQRVLCSAMHGFIAHEDISAFSHYPVDNDECYRLSIQCIVDGIREFIHKRQQKIQKWKDDMLYEGKDFY